MNIILELLDAPYPPARSKKGDAAWDLFCPTEVLIESGRRSVIGLGFKIQLPEGHCALIVERSGHAAQYGIRSIGPLIDPNYRGIPHAILQNHGNREVKFNRGDRIAQMLILPFHGGNMVLGTVNETDRGELGLGSSGN